jgi:hypothetical protein
MPARINAAQRTQPRQAAPVVDLSSDQRKVVADNRISVADARKYMSQLLSRKYQLTDEGVMNVMATLRNAGFTTDAQRTGAELYRTFQTALEPYTTTGSVGLQRDLSRLEELLPKAAQQGIIDQATFLALRKKVAEWKQEFRLPTAAELAEAAVRRAQTNQPLYQKAEANLSEAKNLRAYVDRKNGWLSTGLGDAMVLMKLIGPLENTRGQLGGAAAQLQSALALPDSDATKPEKVREANKRVEALLQSIRPKDGDAVKYLDQKREAYFEWGNRVATAAGFVPGIGKTLSFVLKGTEAGLRYLSGDWSAAEAVSKTLLAAVDAKLGDKLVGSGSMASQAVRAFVSKALQGSVGDVVGVMTNRNIPPEKLGEAIKTAIASNVCKALVDALGKIAGGAIKIRSRQEAVEVYKFILSAADKLGIQQVLYEPLKKFKDAWKL